MSTTDTTDIASAERSTLKAMFTLLAISREVAGLADRRRETAALATGGRAMVTVSVISVIPVASR